VPTRKLIAIAIATTVMPNILTSLLCDTFAAALLGASPRLDRQGRVDRERQPQDLQTELPAVRGAASASGHLLAGGGGMNESDGKSVGPMCPGRKLYGV
jgi:hypothetical protein